MQRVQSGNRLQVFASACASKDTTALETRNTEHRTLFCKTFISHLFITSLAIMLQPSLMLFLVDLFGKQRLGNVFICLNAKHVTFMLR